MISQTVATASAWDHMPDTLILGVMQHQHQFEAIYLFACNLLHRMYLCPSMSQLLTNGSTDFKSVKSHRWCHEAIVAGNCVLSTKGGGTILKVPWPNVVSDPACQFYCITVCVQNSHQVRLVAHNIHVCFQARMSDESQRPHTPDCKVSNAGRKLICLCRCFQSMCHHRFARLHGRTCLKLRFPT